MSSLASVGAVGAVAPPASCTFDPAFGGSGVVVTTNPADGYQLDRMELDREGRLYTISNRVVDNSYALDRVRRFTTDGAIDIGFGTNGFVDLPGQMLTGTGRALAVDDLGRVWVVRNSFTNVREVLRITADGQLDASLPLIEFEGSSAESFDFVGAITSDAQGVVLGHAVNRGDNFAVLHLVRIASDGTTESSRSLAVDGLGFVAAVDTSGWMAGNFRDPDPRPLLWRGDKGSFGSDVYFPDQTVGAFTDVVVKDGVATAMGSVFDGEIDGFGAAVTLQVDAAVLRGFFNDFSETGTELDRAGFDGLPLALFPDGSLAGFSGDPVSPSFVVGTLGTGGAFTPTAERPAVGLAAYPAPSTVTRDGARVVAGYHDYPSSEAFVVSLTPELGPEVSESALDDQILRLYESYYLRAPDAGGLAFWRAQRASGRSLETISAQFADAPEFADLYGDLTDAAFVDLIYTNVLGRLGDDTGRAFWASQLASTARTRGAVMLEFSESTENLDRTGTAAPHDDQTGSVYRLYKAYFNRPPDAGGSCFWVRRLVGGASLDVVSGSFASSQEFIDRYGSLSNREFVELVYSNVLGRPGETSGVEFWIAELDAGRRTRGQVMTGFSESAEYIERTGTLPTSA